MRILHAYNQHRGGGGGDNVARATIEASRRFGLEVQVFTRSSDDLPKNFLGRLQAGASVIYAHGAVREFIRTLDAFRPDIVHLHEVFPLVSPWILPPCSRRGIPVVMTCVDYRLTCPLGTHLDGDGICTRCTHGREYWVVLKNCRRNLTESLTVALYNTLVRTLRLFDSHVSRFITPSEFTRRWFIDNAGIEPARVTAIAPLVNVQDSGVDPAAGSYVGFAGRFDPEKGIDTLLQAGRLCDLPIRLCRNERSLVRIQVPPEADVVVTRSREELDDFYRGARMLVVPSLGLETFGLAAAEPMSHGAAVIVSDHGGLSCLVSDGIDGMLFEPGNARDLADKMARLWNDPELCRRLGRAARQKAASLWNPRRHFEHHWEVYEELCRRPAKGPPPITPRSPPS